MLLISTASRLKVNWAAHGLFYLQSPPFHPITTSPQAAHITSAQSHIHGETMLLSCSAEKNNSCSGRDRSDCFLCFRIASISPNLTEVKGWGEANWGEPTKGGLRNSLKVNILLSDSNWSWERMKAFYAPGECELGMWAVTRSSPPELSC